MYNNMISTKLINYISIRNYSTISKKKILICGNDIPGLTLALFLKKKGISSEIIESNNNIGGSNKNDNGILLTNNSYKIFENNGSENIANEILKNSVQLNGIGYFSKNGRPYGFLNFLNNFKNIQPTNSIAFSTTESKIKEILTNQLNKVNRGEGNISFKKGLRIKKISENNEQQQQQQDNSGVFITFSNSHLKIHYDMVIGSSNCYESQDPVREYLSDKLEKSSNLLFGKESSILRYFTTVINNNVDSAPPIITTQFQREKKLVSFILPNNKIALSGSFYKKQLKQQQSTNETITNYKNFVSGEFSIFEDLGAHNIVSLQDNQNELSLGNVDEYSLKSYAHNSLCLIGDAADKLPQDTLFGTVIGIEDAHKLVETITKDDNNNKDSNNIPKQLQEFNKDRVKRMDKYMKLFTNDKRSIFDYHFFLLLLGRLYLKMVYSSKNQYNRIKDFIN